MSRAAFSSARMIGDDIYEGNAGKASRVDRHGDVCRSRLRPKPERTETLKTMKFVEAKESWRVRKERNLGTRSKGVERTRMVSATASNYEVKRTTYARSRVNTLGKAAGPCN